MHPIYEVHFPELLETWKSTPCIGIAFSLSPKRLGTNAPRRRKASLRWVTIIEACLHAAQVTPSLTSLITGAGRDGERGERWEGGIVRGGEVGKQVGRRKKSVRIRGEEKRGK